MGVTYANPITVRDVSLAIERFLIADFGTSWTPARVDISNPPAGFRDLGPVDEETPTITVSKGIFELQTGIPRVLQFQATVSLAARVTFNIQTRDTRAVINALGSVPSNAAKYLAPANLTVVSTPTAPTATVISLANSPANAWYVGDEIVLASSTPAWDTSQNYAIISSINGLEVHFAGQGFNPAPVVDDFVGKPVANFIPFGTTALPAYTLLGVADFIDGFQLVHRFDKVQAAAEFVENIRVSENTKIPFAFNVFGLTSSTWANELVLGERYLFQPV
ncbi:MAG: hypothetical protein Q9M19_04875 [Mariprofundaceae bacterium]|nr:hypothetical protein [Mariprofundaceae bacterium]